MEVEGCDKDEQDDISVLRKVNKQHTISLYKRCYYYRIV